MQVGSDRRRRFESAGTGEREGVGEVGESELIYYFYVGPAVTQRVTAVRSSLTQLE